MTIWNLGSINIDHVYRVPHLPVPGETLAATGYARGLGGKGANQSVAAARMGARVHHLGAMGAEDGWLLERLAGLGLDLGGIRLLDAPTGHAIITVDPAGENAIVLFPGANRMQDPGALAAALAAAGPGDSLLLQNETDAQVEAARSARDAGARVIYSAAPFSAEAVRAVLPHVSLLAMNEGEAEALRAAMGSLPDRDMIVTGGAKGAEWISASTETVFQPAFAVKPVDTTGAGDCFIGALAAGLDLGQAPAVALRRAAAAAALQVTRPGAADAMPTAAEVDRFLSERG